MSARHRSHKLVFGVLSLGIALLLTTACGGESSTSNDGSTLRFGFVGSTKLPADEFGWGLKQGIVAKIFATHGIQNVTTTSFGTGPDLNEAVISHRIDVTSSGDTPALTARGSGAETKLLSTPSYMYSIVIAKADGPASITELSGKKIAVVKGSTMHRFLVDALAKKGVDAQIININSTGDSIAALRRGEVDAVATVPYIEVVNASLKDGSIRQIVNAGDYNIKSLRVNTVTDQYLSGTKNFVDVWAQARGAALADIRKNPGAYYDWLAETTGSPRADIERLYPLSEVSDTSLNPDYVAALSGTKDFLVSQKLIRRDFDVASWTAGPVQQ